MNSMTEERASMQSEIWRLERELASARAREKALVASVLLAIRVLEQAERVDMTHAEKRGLSKLVVSLLRGAPVHELDQELPF